MTCVLELVPSINLKRLLQCETCKDVAINHLTKQKKKSSE